MLVFRHECKPSVDHDEVFGYFQYSHTETDDVYLITQSRLLKHTHTLLTSSLDMYMEVA